MIIPSLCKCGMLFRVDSRPPFFCHFGVRYNDPGYNETEDSVLCHICATAVKKGKMKESMSDVFVTKGFINWKDATVAFNSHQQTKCHKNAVDIVITIPSTTKDVGELLSKEHAKEKVINRRKFVKIVTSIKYLARQGISLRRWR